MIFQDTNDSILEADEASQIEAAIKASLAEDVTDESDPPSTNAEDDAENKEDSDALETFDSETDDIDYTLEKKGAKQETIKRTFNGESVLCKRKINSEVKDDKNGSDSLCDEEKSSDSKCSNDEEEWKSHLGPSTDPESKLMLRLPDGSRDIVSMPSSSKLMVCSY